MVVIKKTINVKLPRFYFFIYQERKMYTKDIWKLIKKIAHL